MRAKRKFKNNSFAVFKLAKQLSHQTVYLYDYYAEDLTVQLKQDLVLLYFLIPGIYILPYPTSGLRVSNNI